MLTPGANMRAHIVVTLTPRQAVAAARACELAGATTGDRRAWAARHRIFTGLRDAGWEWDEDREAWTRAEGDRIGDPS